MKQLSFIVFTLLSLIISASASQWQFFELYVDNDCQQRQKNLTMVALRDSQTCNVFSTIGKPLVYTKISNKIGKMSIKGYTDEFCTKEDPDFAQASNIKLNDCIISSKKEKLSMKLVDTQLKTPVNQDYPMALIYSQDSTCKNRLSTLLIPSYEFPGVNKCQVIKNTSALYVFDDPQTRSSISWRIYNDSLNCTGKFINGSIGYELNTCSQLDGDVHQMIFAYAYQNSDEVSDSEFDDVEEFY